MCLLKSVPGGSIVTKCRSQIALQGVGIKFGNSFPGINFVPVFNRKVGKFSAHLEIQIRLVLSDPSALIVELTNWTDAVVVVLEEESEDKIKLL